MKYLAFNTPANIQKLPAGPISDVNGLQGFIGAVLIWMFWGLLVLGVAMFLVGGYKYVTSGGEPEKRSGANRTLLYATVAIAVALVAAGIPYIVASFFNVPLGNF